MWWGMKQQDKSTKKQKETHKNKSKQHILKKNIKMKQHNEID